MNIKEKLDGMARVISEHYGVDCILSYSITDDTGIVKTGASISDHEMSRVLIANMVEDMQCSLDEMERDIDNEIDNNISFIE